MTHAVIEFAGKQYKVEEGSSIKVPHVKGKVGTKVSINNVLYLENGDKKTVGFPRVAGKKLEGEIISHGRDSKVVVFKFKRRKGYQKKNTHRNEYTILKFGKFDNVKKQVAVKRAKKAVPPTDAKMKSAEKKETAIKETSKSANKKSSAPIIPLGKAQNIKKEEE